MGEYSDIVVDTSSALVDNSGTGGTKILIMVTADATANASRSGAGVPAPSDPYANWSNVQGTWIGGINSGVSYQPHSRHNNQTFQWMNAAGTAKIAVVDSSTQQGSTPIDFYDTALITSSGNECVQTDTAGHLNEDWVCLWTRNRQHYWCASIRHWRWNGQRTNRRPVAISG